MKHPLLPAATTAVAIVLSIAPARAQGDLDPPPGPPGPTMKTLAQVEPRTPIGALPATLATPGSYYLTSNLTGADGEAGITVEADDVTIDLGGFVLAGVAGSLDGIVVSGARVNLVVKNGTLREWGGDGLNAAEATGGGYFNVRAVDNVGAGVRAGERSTVKDCTAIGNDGGGIRSAYHALVGGCMATGNGEIGIFCEAGGTIRDCVAINTGGPGIAAGDASVIEGCTSRDNGGNGVTAGAGSVIGRCAATANGGTGVQAGPASTVKECSAKNNAGAGVSVVFGSTVRDCVARQNGVEGIYLTDRCVVLDNNASENSAEGIRATGNHNRIEGNHLSSNLGGVKVDAGGVQNFIVRNTSRAERDGPGFDVPSENTCPVVFYSDIATAGPWANFTDTTN